jgi:hypothetical protein
MVVLKRSETVNSITIKESLEPKGAVQTGVQPTSPKILVQMEDDKGGAGNSLREAIKQA